MLEEAADEAPGKRPTPTAAKRCRALDAGRGPEARARTGAAAVRFPWANGRTPEGMACAGSGCAKTPPVEAVDR